GINRQNENPARALARAGSPGTLMSGRQEGKLRGLRLANSRGAPEVPHGTSCSLLTRHHAQAAAVLDHSRTLPQGNGRSGPAFARGAVGGPGSATLLETGDALRVARNVADSSV